MTKESRHIWTFFAATFIWSWLCWGLAIVLGANMETGNGIILLLLGVLGPMVMGITFTVLTGDTPARRDYWRRIVDVRRISWKWVAVIVFFALALNGMSSLLDLLTGGVGATWGDVVVDATSNPLSILFTLLFATLIPFIEELGWRGYVLDRLQARHSALTSALILGAVWSLWHLPLFFVEGTYQAGLGLGTLEFWLFFISIAPLTVVFSWAYNNTRRSILAIILFHGMVNFAGEVIALSPRADIFATVLWGVVAVGVVAIWGSKNLSRKPAHVEIA